jgi:3',5'-cyclic-nucleotide phosphodiesterase
MVAERWTHLLQQEFASQGEMENQVGMETTLFGGPPEIGNMMKLANGQIGFMGIFAHPLFANVTDVIPAMGFAATEITNNKTVWITRIEREKRKQQLTSEGGFNDGAVSPRSQSPAPRKLDKLHTAHSPSTGYFPASPLRQASNPPSPLQQKVKDSRNSSDASIPKMVATDDTPRNQSKAPAWKSPFAENGSATIPNINPALQELTPTSSGVFPGAKPQVEAPRPDMQTRRSSNAVPRSLQMNGMSDHHDESTTTTTTTTTASSEQGGDEDRRKSELRKSDYTTASVPLIYDDSVPDLPNQQKVPEVEYSNTERPQNQHQSVSVSKYCAVPARPFSQAQHQARNSGRMSVPSTTDSNSMATSGGQTYSTNLSTTLSPSTEGTSFLSVESSEEQVEDRGNGQWDPMPRHGPEYDRAKSSPSLLPEVVPSIMMGRAAPVATSGGDDRRKSPVKTSTSMVREPGQETVSSWDEGDGDRSIRRRMSRFRFWRKKTDEDER